MAFQRIKVFRITVCISVIMYTFLLVSFVWLDTARNTDTNSKVPRIRATKVLIDGKVYPIQDSFDCAKLFNGDGDEMKRAISYLRNKTSIQHFYSRFNYMPLNCEKYKLSRDYITKPFLKSEEDFPMAFNIIFHKGFVQLERLLHVIYRPQHQICIHIDRKTSKDIFEQVKVLVDCFDNVFIASKLEVIVYEGFTRLLADINCMKDHVERNFTWKYLINVAASEYPLMSNLEMVQVLREFDGVNDVEEVMTHTNQDRYRKKHFTYIDAKTLSGRMIHTRERKQSPPHGLTITKGNAYGIFSRAFVEFVLKDKIAHDLLLWLEDTSVSEEHYWSTLNNLYNNPFLNTPGGYKGYPETKPYFARFIAWNKTSQYAQCKDKHYVHNICVFSVRDLPMLKQRREIIANKFDIEYDPIAYACMEEWIHNKTMRHEGISDLGFYKHVNS